MKIKTRITVASLFLATLVSPLMAAGTSSAQFLKMGAGARAAGMGDAFTAVADDVTSAYWNPAGLGQMKSAELALMHNSSLLNSQYQYAGLAKPMGNTTIAASAYRMSYGSIEGYDNNDTKTGSFNAGDTAVALSAAHRVMDGLFIGLTGKYISESIQSESASTFAGDFGVFFKERKFNRFNFGFTMQNLGGGLKFVKESSPLPQTLRAGVSTTLLEGKLLGSVDVSKSNDSQPTVNMGTEFKVNPLLTLRGGYKMVSGMDFTVNGLTNVTGGLGLQLNQFSLDYAFVPFGDLGSTHRVSLMFHFSEN